MPEKPVREITNFPSVRENGDGEGRSGLGTQAGLCDGCAVTLSEPQAKKRWRQQGCCLLQRLASPPRSLRWREALETTVGKVPEYKREDQSSNPSTHARARHSSAQLIVYLTCVHLHVHLCICVSVCSHMHAHSTSEHTLVCVCDRACEHKHITSYYLFIVTSASPLCVWRRHGVFVCPCMCVER